MHRHPDSFRSFDGLTAFDDRTASSDDRALAAALAHLDDALAECGSSWEDVRVAVVHLDAELPGTVSWTALTESATTPALARAQPRRAPAAAPQR